MKSKLQACTVGKPASIGLRRTVLSAPSYQVPGDCLLLRMGRTAYTAAEP